MDIFVFLMIKSGFSGKIPISNISNYFHYLLVHLCWGMEEGLPLVLTLERTLRDVWLLKKVYLSPEPNF